MEMYDFIRSCEDLHLTKNDLEGMASETQLDVVIWDRNFEEYWIWDRAIPNHHYPPLEFFSKNRYTLVYLGDFEWDIVFPWETIKHPIHLSLESLNINYTWAALGNDGIIHIDQYRTKDAKGLISSLIEVPIHKHYSTFPSNTRIGWRGPIILSEKLTSLPNVFYSRRD
jgi:hypothetical protein